MKPLDLDWSLDSAEERTQYVSNHLPENPTRAQIELATTYILWGKNSSGKNGLQEGLQLKTAYGTSKKVESIEALLEQNPNTLLEPETRSLKTPPTKFNRALAEKTLSAEALHSLKNLWRQIDTIDLTLNFYEIHVLKKRTKPPRDELLARFNSTEIKAIETKSLSVTPESYLTKKRLLVELRRSQYSYMEDPKVRHTLPSPHEEPLPFYWDTDTNVYPFPLSYNSPLIWRKDRFPSPLDFQETPLPAPPLSSNESSNTFDFTNPTHLYNLTLHWTTLQDSPLSAPLLERFLIYASLTPLTPPQQKILTLKLSRTPNEKIREILNSTYSLNYISTIFCQNILVKIAETAQKHALTVKSLSKPSLFKTCIDCGRTLLRDPSNFMRKSKNSDGFDCRCKQCAKLKRQKNKGDKNS